MACFVFLVFRLWTIQIYQNEKFKNIAQDNYQRRVVVPSQRGKIRDRYGYILAEDVNFWDVWIPFKRNSRGERIVTKEIDTTLQILSGILERPYNTLVHRYKTVPTDINYKHLRVCIEERIPFNKYIAILERKNEFPDEAMVFTVEMPTRSYRYGDLAAHVLGYTRKIGPKELQQKRYEGYSHRDRIGKSGIEDEYEEFLRGQDGINLIYVDKHEIQRGGAVEVKKAISGNDVFLTIDYKLQQAAELVLGASRGAIIVSNPNDNSILALASSPRYDPNYRITHNSQYITDPDHPLYHRAIASWYPPGSVFKPFELFALLEDLNIDPDDTVYCPGRFSLPGGPTWRCHKLAGHGKMDMINALARSCDVYFYEMVGNRLGMEQLAAWAINFGFNDITGIDIPGEKNYPFPFRIINGKGDKINLSIGQGRLVLTPLQINTALTAIVNRGMLFKPRVSQRIEFVDPNKPDKTFESQLAGTIEATSETFSLVHKAMYEVCNNLVNGTGRRIYDQDPDQPWRYVQDEDFIVAGKTGTAQTASLESGHPSHAWFVCFGPFEDPEIVITVLVENGGHGGDVAAPMAKKIIEVYRGDVELQDLV